MRIVVLWSRLAQYSNAIFESLQDRGNQLRVVYRQREDAAASPFDDERLVGSIDAEPLRPGDSKTAGSILRGLSSFRPDAVVVSGWWSREYRAISTELRKAGVPLVLASDNPLTGSARQRLGRFARYPYLRRFSTALVPGERGAQLMYSLGFARSSVIKGLYGVASRDDMTVRLNSGAWPQTFLFVGRMESEKGVDVLLEGYERYRARAPDPWGLRLIGHGPLLKSARMAVGVEAPGFVQPGPALDRYMRESGAFVLCSRYDPWPLVLVEAAASGLPLVATPQCGSAVELLRTHHNGVMIGEHSADSVAEALYRIHSSYETLPAWGARSLEMASAYTSGLAARRWEDAVNLAVAAPPSGAL